MTTCRGTGRLVPNFEKDDAKPTAWCHDCERFAPYGPVEVRGYAKRGQPTRYVDRFLPHEGRTSK